MPKPSRKQDIIRSGKYSSLLVIECDTKKLQDQAIDIAPQFNKMFSIINSCKYKYIQIDNKADLLSKFAKMSYETQEYNIIVLVAHSILDSNDNPIGIQLASNYSIEWHVLPDFLKIFKPKCLILATCKGGHFLPSGEMFNGLQSLEEIFGSPVIANKKQLWILIFVVLYLSYTKRFDCNIWNVAKYSNYILTGGIILRHTRNEYIKMQPLSVIGNQLIYEFLYNLYKKD